MPVMVALFVADIHLSHKPPRARAGEPNWYQAMDRSLAQLKQLGQDFSCPIFCAGDLFDRWNSPPELINWAWRQLPHLWAIPGQHDLPQHNYGQLHRSAYQTLSVAGTLTDMELGKTYQPSKLMNVTAFPWGSEISTFGKSQTTGLKVALVHEYVWRGKHKYPGAPGCKRVSKENCRDALSYDVVVFGDNHKGFKTEINDTTIINCGTFFRRTIDEIDYQPRVWGLLSTGRVKPLVLDTSGDTMEDRAAPETDRNELDISGFVSELEGLEQDSVDFREMVEMYAKENEVNPTTLKILIEAMDDE